MKQNIKITLSGVMAALSVVFMLFSYFPYLTYAIPAISGLFIMVLVIEINSKWAFTAYLASAVLVFIFAEPESKLLYICFFGYYPIVKALVERINKNVVEWVIKLLVFNAAVVSVYLIFSNLFGISLKDFEMLGKFGAYILLFAGNIVFIIYDFAVSRMATVYLNVIHPKIARLLKK